MTDRTTINVTKDAHTAAHEAKEANNHTWSDVLEWYADNVNTDCIGEGEEPTQAIDTQEILNRLDDLETQLPAKIAEELR